MVDIDQSSGSFMPFYDEDTQVRSGPVGLRAVPQRRRLCPDVARLLLPSKPSPSACYTAHMPFVPSSLLRSACSQRPNPSGPHPSAPIVAPSSPRGHTPPVSPSGRSRRRPSTHTAAFRCSTWPARATPTFGTQSPTSTPLLRANVGAPHIPRPASVAQPATKPVR